MPSSLPFMSIVIPLLAAGVCYCVRIPFVRTSMVLLTSVVTISGSLMFLSGGPFTHTPADGPWHGLDWAVTLADFALLGLIHHFGARYKRPLIRFLAVAQAVPLLVFEIFMVRHDESIPMFHADGLSLIMVFVVCLVGSLICVYAIPYMKRHEEHHPDAPSRQPEFFFFLLAFLGAMNALVLTNNLIWLYFFFEVTTLCSFMLIKHDGDDLSVHNALRALWMNSLGGLAFVVGMIWAHAVGGTLDIQRMIGIGAQSGALLMPMAFLCFAGFTKAAQVPFQSWLLGAMVAPTPVSALLHSSTMVKAGVFVVLRFAPAYAGTFFSHCVTIVGSFTFLVAIALALGQRNAKKILAYSTISNLGLIIACAGLNTPTAITAGILMILFHAISKGLLFLCVGTIEQHIGSRDIEDMRGVFNRMPRTAVITVIAITSMLLPPFGVLICKWMAIESASHNLFATAMIAVGSSIGFMVYGRWAGIMMSAPYRPDIRMNPRSPLRISALVGLAGCVIGFSAITPWIYVLLVDPMMLGAYSVRFGGFESEVGVFTVFPLSFVLGAALFFAYHRARKSVKADMTPMYMGGVHSGGVQDESFIGPMGQIVQLETGNYYFQKCFAEDQATFWVNHIAVGLLVLMLGGAL